MTAILAAGCAPGRISEYARQAQQAGERVFEGEAVAVLQEESAEVEEQQFLAETITVETQGTEPPEQESGAAPGESGSGIAEETEAVSEGQLEETMSAAESGQARTADWPEMMRQVPERVQEAWARQREAFSGHLVGLDRLNGTEQAALAAVLARKGYDDRTLCVQNSARFARSSIAVTVSDADETLCVLVSDDGCGFSPRALDQAAKPFYRARESGEEGHLGIGLNICRILCSRHGGELTVANNVKGGALVCATFAMGA